MTATTEALEMATVAVAMIRLLNSDARKLAKIVPPLEEKIWL